MSRYLKLILPVTVIIILLVDYRQKEKNKDLNKSLKVINIYYSNSPGFMLINLADKLGYFRDNGIKLNYVLETDGDVAYADLRSGKLDAFSETISGFYSKVFSEKEADIKIVLMPAYSNGSYAIIARKDAPLIKDDTKKIFSGMEDNEMFVYYALDKLGATTTNINFTPAIFSNDEILDKLAKKEIDYAIMFEPGLSQAVSEGNKIIFSSSEEPGILMSSILFSKKIIDNNPETIDSFLRVYFKAYDFWQKNPRQAYRIVSGFILDKPENIERQMQSIKMLNLEDNINALSNVAGFTSVYNILRQSQYYEFREHGIKDTGSVYDMVYEGSLRRIFNLEKK